MGTATLALSAMIPMWIEYKQVIQVRDQVQQQVADMHKRIDRNNYYIKAYTEDPEAIDMLALTDLRYRRPDEAAMPLPSQLVSQIRPAGWDAPPTATAGRKPPKAPTPAKSPADLHVVEKYVERAKALTREHLGTARSIALVEMFCDATCRKVLTAAALALLAAALLLCKSSPAGKAD